MNIAIKSGDRSLKHYLETFKQGESLLKRFEESLRENSFNENSLNQREKEQLCYLLKKVEVLYETYFSNGKVSNIDITKPDITIQEMKTYYQSMQEKFHIKA